MTSFTIIDAEQRSDAWKLARVGRLTSSRAADMLATIQKGESAGRRNLRMQLVLERVTGRPQERGYVSPAMQNGTDKEAAASAAYEAITGTILQRTGFLSHNELMVGCSLDGHFGDFEGIVEIKAPLSATHWEYLKTGVIPGEYLKQITHALWISGAEWCDWMSYDDAFPERLQAKLVRVSRSAVDLTAYKLAARLFLSEVDKEVGALAGMVAA